MRPPWPKFSSPKLGGCMPRPTSPSIDNHVGRPLGRHGVSFRVPNSAGACPALHHLHLKTMWGGPCGRRQWQCKTSHLAGQSVPTECSNLPSRSRPLPLSTFHTFVNVIVNLNEHLSDLLPPFSVSAPSFPPAAQSGRHIRSISHPRGATLPFHGVSLAAPARPPTRAVPRQEMGQYHHRPFRRRHLPPIRNLRLLLQKHRPGNFITVFF